MSHLWHGKNGFAKMVIYKFKLVRYRSENKFDGYKNNYVEHSTGS